MARKKFLVRKGTCNYELRDGNSMFGHLSGLRVSLAIGKSSQTASLVFGLC